ncbi:hypothetical protein [Thermomonospora umbrina]|uniref:Uncharacterized protein n=1 Tax=Thermomonospora umbrina TaxID=111806 RepID=A0A3D9SPC1_9ACTN|nr:hypothetical protein [Thermomonospora umbrina]REE97758.1 hypothetical protein DFJ69_3233 [Thermomonospora umbrina]
MDVVFTRTGSRRYGVSIGVPGESPRWQDPSPGFDEHIPHDLVHYVLEAELGLSAGVFGRAARGGGGFHPSEDLTARERARLKRKAKKREAGLNAKDHAGSADMALAESLAALCDALWRQRHGGLPDERPPWVTPPNVPDEYRPQVERVLSRLDEVAPLWNALGIGESLTFTWPSVVPHRAPAR